MAKQYIMRFYEPAENSLAGWVNRSFMLGNGYFGANVFGGAAAERISLSEQSLRVVGAKYINERYSAGNECFAFLHIDTKHNDARCKNYVRELCMNTGIATVEYDFEDVHYTREYFTSYPDKVLVIRLKADKPGALSFRLRPRIAYEREHLVFPGDGRYKRATTSVLDENTLEIRGVLGTHEMEMNLFARVCTEGGSVRTEEANGQISLLVQGADSAQILVSLGTNYDLDKVAFGLPDAEYAPEDLLKNCPSRRDEYLLRLEKASAMPYVQLKARHLEDFQTLFERVLIDFGGADDGRATNKLLLTYKNGIASSYLEELHFQMGRYMLLCSSREGGLPANLQSIWNMFEFAPWTCGFWYNINIQMNYWPTFVCNLKECFAAYHNFNKARFAGCSTLADNYIKNLHPAQYEDVPGANGWIVGTGNSSLHIGAVGGHSGPGTGGLTTKAYWDYYAFTHDVEILKNEAYPFLEAVARFYTKCVEEIDGKMLVTHSSSPEQKIDGAVYVTTGCGFDQQMLHESIHDYIKASEILGLDSGIVDKNLYAIAKAQADLYDPIQVGASGQIKEYREENEYGEYGEIDHRHISQLVAAFPGTLLQRENPAWSDAAKQTVLLRGLNSGKGWTKAHKMLVLARNGGTDEALKMAECVLRENVFDNLWNDHCGVAVFQADANFGLTAAYAEILLQSHAGYIDVLPQIPEKWQAGSFDGLCARGNFEVGASWSDGAVQEIRIRANVDGECIVRCADLSYANVRDSAGNAVAYVLTEDGKCRFTAQKDTDYVIDGILPMRVCLPVTDLCAKTEGEQVQLSWACAASDAVFCVYKAEDSEAKYTLVASNLKQCSYTDRFSAGRVTYKVTAKTNTFTENSGAVLFLSK